MTATLDIAAPDPAATAETTAAWAAEVRELARKRNAVILAHNYQLPQIQDVADHVGDSLTCPGCRDRRGVDDRLLRRALHGRDREDPLARTRPC